MLAMPQVKLDASRHAVSMFRAGRPTRGLADQNGVGRKEGGEHDDVAEQEDPEAVADHDPFRRGAAVGSCSGVAMSAGVAQVCAIGREWHRGHVV
jgi:hypothetical protein